MRAALPPRARWGTVPPRTFVSTWAESGVRRPIAKPSSPPVPAVRSGGVSVGRPQIGRLVDGVQLQPTPVVEVMFPAAAWGTSLTIEAIYDRTRSAWERFEYGLSDGGASARPSTARLR